MKTQTSAAGPLNRQQLVISITLGVAFYLLLDAIEPYIALPLRQVSSTVAAWLLNALFIPVTQSGTILSTERFVFDVEPACSGSTTLRVLMSMGVLWCGMHPSLTLPRRLLAATLMIPMALAANGIRVALLVGLGDALLQPVEGAMHSAIGVLGFVIAMSGVYGLTSILATTAPAKAPGQKALAAVFVVLLMILYSPVAVWIGARWKLTPVEAWGGLWILAGVFLLLLQGVRIRRPTPSVAGVLVFATSVLCLALATMIDVKTLQGWSMLLGWFGLALMFLGWRVALAAAPLLALIALGFPMVPTFIATVTQPLLGSVNPALIWSVRGLLGLALVGLHVILVHQAGPFAMRQANPAPGPTANADALSPRRWLPIVVLAAVLGVAAQAYLGGTAARLEQQPLPEIPYLIGDWVGEDNVLTDIEIDTIGKERILSRKYRHGQAEIHLMVTSAGADYRRAHSPEWCMTGTGWEVLSREETSVGGEEPARVMKCLMRKQAREVDYYYWFVVGGEAIPSYEETMARDFLKRRVGSLGPILLVRVVCARGSELPLEFVTTLRSSLR